MSADPKSFVDRYAEPDDKEESEANVHPISGELQCFGFAQENRMRPAMLVFRTKTGDQKALMYSYLVEVDFNPSEGIVLKFVSHRITLKGRHLELIFNRLVEQRVSWIQEMDESLVKDEAATVVSAIEIGKV